MIYFIRIQHHMTDNIQTLCQNLLYSNRAPIPAGEEQF